MTRIVFWGEKKNQLHIPLLLGSGITPEFRRREKTHKTTVYVVDNSMHGPPPPPIPSTSSWTVLYLNLGSWQTAFSKYAMDISFSSVLLPETFTFPAA